MPTLEQHTAAVDALVIRLCEVHIGWPGGTNASRVAAMLTVVAAMLEHAPPDGPDAPAAVCAIRRAIPQALAELADGGTDVTEETTH